MRGCFASAEDQALPPASYNPMHCSVGERAYEWADKEHDVFSYYLLQGLRGQAVNDKGQVTITDLANYIQQQVVDWARTYRGKTANPLAEPAGICQPSFDRNLFICCRQKPIMPRIGEAYTFASASMDNNYSR